MKSLVYKIFDIEERTRDGIHDIVLRRCHQTNDMSDTVYKLDVLRDDLTVMNPIGNFIIEEITQS